MKTIKTAILIGIIMLFHSCITGHPGENTSDAFQFQNSSGHRVAVVIDEGMIFPVPDSLVIAHGDTYKWENIRYSGISYPFNVRGEIEVYYDDDVKIVFDGSQDRDPRDRERNFPSIEISENRFLGTYTFTVEDYEQAVRQNEM